MKEIVVNGYTRIDKREALKMYKNGFPVYVLDSTLTPGYNNIAEIKKSPYISSEDIENSFNINVHRKKCAYMCKEVYFYKITGENTQNISYTDNIAKYLFTDKTKHLNSIPTNWFTKINKLEALSLYKNGYTVYALDSSLTPGYGNVASIKKSPFRSTKECISDFEVAINRTNMSFMCKNVYFYKLTNNLKYKLLADFGNKVRIMNIVTGQLLDVDKKVVIDRIDAGMIEVQGYRVLSNRTDLIAFTHWM